MQRGWAAGVPAPGDEPPADEPDGAAQPRHEPRPESPSRWWRTRLRAEERATPTPMQIPGIERLLAERRRVRTWAQVGLLLLALLVCAYFARTFLLQVFMAMLLYLILLPAIHGLKRLRIPEPFGAALLTGGFVVLSVAVTWRVSGPAAQWLENVPDVLRRLEYEIQGLRGSMSSVSEAAEQVAEMTDGDDGFTQKVKIQEAPFSDVVLGTTASFLTSAFAIVALLYFLLASGDSFMRRLGALLPGMNQGSRTGDLLVHVQRSISTYLVTVSLINAGLGVVVGVAMWLLGMPNPFLWGVLAALVNFVPYIGAAALCLALGLAAFVTFDDFTRSLIPPLVFIACTTLEGTFVTPSLLGRNLRLDPVLIFVSLLFWGWLWGVPGMILAVPILVVMKITCDHVEALVPLGRFMSR